MFHYTETGTQLQIICVSLCFKPHRPVPNGKCIKQSQLSPERPTLRENLDHHSECFEGQVIYL